MYYTIEKIEKHWQQCESVFTSEYGDWINAFDLLVPLSGEVIRSLEGRKALAENCTHLLLSKAFNHTLATYSLMPRGLVIDASLTARNAVETFLMLELFTTDPTESYFEEWADGREFKPAWIRRQLGQNLRATVRDVVIEFDDDYYESVKLAYSLWSGITHANLKSAQYSLKPSSSNELKVPTGGQLEGYEHFINCLFAVTGNGLLRCSLVSAAVFSTALLQDLSAEFSEAQRRINRAGKRRLKTQIAVNADGA